MADKSAAAQIGRLTEIDLRDAAGVLFDKRRPIASPQGRLATVPGLYRVAYALTAMADELCDDSATEPTDEEPTR